MKRMILGLALCLGISQVAVAQREVSMTEEGALAWIKNNPKKAIAIGAAVAATLTYAGFAVVEICKADGKDGKVAKAKAGLKNAASDCIFPVKWVAGKAVAGKDAAVANMKAHSRLWIGVPAGVVAIIAAAVIAELVTDEESNLRVTNLWNKLFKKAAKEEVVA
jgi:hypothetical protein